MKAYISFKMSKPIDKDLHYLSPGGYEVTTKDGKSYQFDFNECYGYIDKNDKSIVEFELRNEDYDTFPDIEEMLNHIHEIEKFDECYLYIEDNLKDDEKLKLLKILEFRLVDYSEDAKDLPKSSEYVIISRVKINGCYMTTYAFTEKLINTCPIEE